MNGIPSLFPRRRVFPVLLALCFAWAGGFATAAEVGTELKERGVLRVCADPSNMPFSNKAKEGFENKIAEFLAAELGIPLAYTWFPQSMGFVRLTLRARRCDLIIGVSAAHELVQNTNPYYSSVFSVVQFVDADYEVKSLSDAVLRDKGLRIGVVAGTPPVDILLEKKLMDQVKPYHLRRADISHSPIAQMSEDLLAKKIDVAILWGPMAGHLVRQNAPKLKLSPLTADNSQRHRLIFPITMGIRRGELQWRRQLNRVLRKNEEKLHDILLSYNIPVVESP